MKPARFLLPLILLSVLACRKSGLQNSIIGNANDSSGLFSASIDGKPWIASVKFASIMNGGISISGTDAHNNALSITLGEELIDSYSLGLKTGNVGEYTDSSMYLQEFSTNHSASQADGKVVVTAIDKVNKTITGNFTMNLYCDSLGLKRKITDGNFKNLPYVTELPPAKATDTFYVQINGTDWSAKSISAGLIAGQMLVNGSEQDASRSVSIYFPHYNQSGWLLDFDPIYIEGTYHNAGQSYSNVKYFTLPNGLLSGSSYPGFLQMVEDDHVNRRMRARFDFKAATSAGADSVELSNGYFSVQY